MNRKKEICIRLENVDVGYGKKIVVQKINLDITKGKITTLIGPNGAGKSTILKSIIRQLKPITGGISIHDQNELKKIETISQKEFAKKVSVMLTNKIDPELMTVRDVIEMGRYPYTNQLGVLKKDDKIIVDDIISKLKLNDLENMDFNKISDGQKQRVLLARALCQNPEILILDEPTSFLDIKHKISLLQILKNLAKENDITIIMTLHEVELAQKISDNVICVKDKSIFNYGKSSDIFKDNTINELYGINREENGYDYIFSTVEFPKVVGEAKTMVISNCGSGIDVYRQLQKENIPFHAGIVYKNDIDYNLAKKLAVDFIEIQPYEEITDEDVRRAKIEIDKMEKIILLPLTYGSTNDKLKEVVEYAKSKFGL
ncbi:ABC transporter ATP-binding protein [Lachnobacterium bovis]|uniref:ABC transporter ATP-binding protein n=1 Tax=Lachnobacterium bovis TaxID=140626 RepID=UPI0004801C60|nr:ABC transporter ATP-binding protein [Lachnobacterium bovis]